ncbi:MAG: protease complex subunit PrcB family protein [Lachnospiraceae bacterium]
MNKKCNWMIRISILVFLIACLTGCQKYQSGKAQIKKLDFTVCDNDCLPDELLDMIQEKKKEPFRMTYRTKDYMYIIVGYGGCDRTDVYVTVSSLYLTKNGIVIETDLVSNGEERLQGDILSYPYIVVKCELYDEQVIFQS